MSENQLQENKKVDAKKHKLLRRYAVATAWFIFWMITWVIVFGGLTLGIGATIYMLMGGESVSSGAHARLYLTGLTVVLALICILFIRRLKRRRQTYFRITGRIVLCGYMTLGVLLGLWLSAVTPDAQLAEGSQNTQVAGSIIVPELIRDPTIDSALEKIGASHSETVKFSTEYVPGYEVQGKEGEYQIYINPATGRYMYGKMTIKSGLDANNTLSTIAHEYLHHVWYAVLDEPTKLKLTSDLITMYGNDSPVKSRAKGYTDTQRLQPTELFSIYCTESTDSYLTEYVRSECEKYINRNAFLMLR